MLLENKTAFVTGGSRGIGAAVVNLYIKNGIKKVIFTYNTNKKAAESLVSEIINNYGEEYREKVKFFQLDLSSSDLEKILAEHLKEEKIDILVNNAGVIDDGLFLVKDFKKWMKVIEINFLGAIKIIKFVLPQMIYYKEGCIINILSVGGLIGILGQTNYTSAKAALLSFSKSLSKEIARFNIRINNVAPGYVDTDMVRHYPEEIRKKFLQNIPLNRFAFPEEIANVVIFLSSSLSSYITGQTIIVDGGLTS